VPELPEVEYVRRRLRPAMEGARIERVLARRPDLRYPLGANFVARLEGQTVRAVTRRAKYLVVELSSGETLLMHLGMSGWFSVLRRRRVSLSAGPPEGGHYVPVRPKADTTYERSQLAAHDHVVFEMSSGTAVVFNDPRRFGFMKLMAAGELARDPGMGALGPEPLARSFTAEVLVKALRGKRKVSIKSALLDQRVVAGLGNIYVCEALHLARLSPKRRASTLITRSGAPAPGAAPLVEAIKTVLQRAIANSHQAGSDDRFRVYDREGRRCPRRGCAGTIRRIVQAGRSTFFCPVCQR
jgi:formamidopyrimidine-DNA glycosylase